MMEKTVVIGSKSGLHARPASLVVKQAGQFKSTIEIATPQKTVNLKSLIAVMSLGLKQGAQATLRVSGPDEAEALETLSKMLESELD